MACLCNSAYDVLFTSPSSSACLTLICGTTQARLLTRDAEVKEISTG